MSQIWVMDDLTTFRLEGEAMENMFYLNTTQQPNLGFEGAAWLDGAAQFQPPQENPKAAVPSREKDEGSKNKEVKKRRISVEQVRRLEASFNLKNKLEPNQKSRLAKELGLEPRQVVIWFQNRRARIKGKRLETEYYTLKDQYDSLKVDYEYLLMEKERLQNEVSMLSNKLKMRNEEKSNSGSVNGSVSTVEENKLLVAPQEEDPLKGLGTQSMGFESGFGQLEGDAFDCAFGESFDFLLSGMDDIPTYWCSKLGF